MNAVMMARMLVRGALAIAAVLILAWFGVLYRDWLVGRAAAERIHYHANLSTRELSHELDQLDSARLLDPDRYWELVRTRYQLADGRPAEAFVSASRFVGDEPDNVDGWTVFYEAALRRGSPRAKAAAVEIRRLNPLTGQNIVSGIRSRVSESAR
jgi:hypothetical protein